MQSFNFQCTGVLGEKKTGQKENLHVVRYMTWPELLPRNYTYIIDLRGDRSRRNASKTRPLLRNSRLCEARASDCFLSFVF
jgi:hypothetical protein